MRIIAKPIGMHIVGETILHCVQKRHYQSTLRGMPVYLSARTTTCPNREVEKYVQPHKVRPNTYQWRSVASLSNAHASSKGSEYPLST